MKIYEDFSEEFGGLAGDEPFPGALTAEAPAAAALAAAPLPAAAGKGGTFVLSTTWWFKQYSASSRRSATPSLSYTLRK